MVLQRVKYAFSFSERVLSFSLTMITMIIKQQIKNKHILTNAERVFREANDVFFNFNLIFFLLGRTLFLSDDLLAH